MKIIAGVDTSIDFESTKKFLDTIDEGIVVFPEGSFDKAKGLGWTIKDLQEYTQNKAMTLIGSANDRDYIIRNGNIEKAQWGPLIKLTDEDWWEKSNKIYEIGYETQNKVDAILRICADGETPYEKNGKADILIVSSGGVDWKNDIEHIKEIHKNSLKEDGLIVQSDQHLGTKFIYSLKENDFVGEEHFFEDNKDDKYVLYEKNTQE